jgi:hypothetical protein
MAERWRRNIEVLSCAREMQLFRNRYKIPKMPQFHNDNYES